MGETHAYLVPDYYRHFACKGADCRSSCCLGWGISISMEEYFRLLGLDCSPALRRRLDVAFHLAEARAPQHYAQVTPTWEGDCPLHGRDGLCALQKECGVDSLPAVCRYYPRGPRRTGDYRECSCANSCEAVLEMLFARADPLSFRQEALTFDMAAPSLPEIQAAGYAPIRSRCLSLLQSRDRSLPQRMDDLGRLIAALAAEAPGYQPALAPQPAPRPLPPGDSEGALGCVKAMVDLFDENSPSIRAYGLEALRRIDGTDALQRAREAFAQAIPAWERHFEQMLVNHLFFEGFPFSGRHDSLWDEYLGLVGVYSLLRFLCVGYLSSPAPQENPLEALADLCAAAFRLIDHSAFHHNAARLLHRLGWADSQRTAQLLRL